MIYRPEGRPRERGGIRVNLLVAWKRPKNHPQKGLEPLVCGDHLGEPSVDLGLLPPPDAD